MEILQKMQFHHIGCLTEDMETTIDHYRNSLGFANVSSIFSIKEQDVKVCFIEMGPDTFIELVEPAGENPSLKKILKSKNPYYHMGYLVDNIDIALAKLGEDGFYLVNRFSSEAFDYKSCAFMYSPDMQLIELIER